MTCLSWNSVRNCMMRSEGMAKEMPAVTLRVLMPMTSPSWVWGEHSGRSQWQRRQLLPPSCTAWCPELTWLACPCLRILRDSTEAVLEGRSRAYTWVRDPRLSHRFPPHLTPPPLLELVGHPLEAGPLTPDTLRQCSEGLEPREGSDKDCVDQGRLCPFPLGAGWRHVGPGKLCSAPLSCRAICLELAPHPDPPDLPAGALGWICPGHQ